MFGTLSYPSHLARRARAAGIEPASLGLRLLVTAGEPGAGLAAVRREIEDAWGARVADTFGMSDVWSTMAGECGHSEGLHLTTGDGALVELCDPETGAPVELEDGATGELVWTHLEREASPLLRYRSADLARVWTNAVPVRPPRPAPAHRGPPRRHDPRAGAQRAPAGGRRRAGDPTGVRPLRASWPRATRSSRRCACSSRRRMPRPSNKPRPRTSCAGASAPPSP